MAYGGKGQANKQILYITHVSDYEVISQYIPISPTLKNVQNEILMSVASSTEFNYQNQTLVSWNFVHKQTYGGKNTEKNIEIGWGLQKCKCKGNATPNGVGVC